MIIHGGSCENFNSMTMVEELGLKIEDHPQPYCYEEVLGSVQY